MGPVNTQLVEQARVIFAELGYTVEGTGSTFRAEREWKVVHVRPNPGDDLPADDGGFHCFVAEPAGADALERRLERVDPAYEWAIIVVDGEEYEVERAPPGPHATPA
ncbi:hypothetical protein OB905_03630 [Halobacteria archaeon AArc-dxtr1]|nr:hypothetical protein [Halobacteria archaeon AArc-dxtr1]